MIVTLLYFFDVFIGMFFVSQQYDDNPELTKKALGVEELSGRSYNIIEIILLAVMSFDAVLKLALTTRQSKRVILHYFYLIEHRDRDERSGPGLLTGAGRRSSLHHRVLYLLASHQRVS